VYKNQKRNIKLQLRDATMLSNELAIRLHPLNLACCVEVYGGRIKKSKFLTVFNVFYNKTIVYCSFSNI